MCVCVRGIERKTKREEECNECACACVCVRVCVCERERERERERVIWAFAEFFSQFEGWRSSLYSIRLKATKHFCSGKHFHLSLTFQGKTTTRLSGALAVTPIHTQRFD